MGKDEERWMEKIRQQFEAAIAAFRKRWNNLPSSLMIRIPPGEMLAIAMGQAGFSIEEDEINPLAELIIYDKAKDLATKAKELILAAYEAMIGMTDKVRAMAA